MCVDAPRGSETLTLPLSDVVSASLMTAGTRPSFESSTGSVWNVERSEQAIGSRACQDSSGSRRPRHSILRDSCNHFTLQFESTTFGSRSDRQRSHLWILGNSPRLNRNSWFQTCLQPRLGRVHCWDWTVGIPIWGELPLRPRSHNDRYRRNSSGRRKTRLVELLL